MKKYIVIDVGCIECGVSTKYCGIFSTREEAEKLAESLPDWRDGGQSCAEVFEIII